MYTSEYVIKLAQYLDKLQHESTTNKNNRPGKID